MTARQKQDVGGDGTKTTQGAVSDEENGVRVQQWADEDDGAIELQARSRCRG
jgi:hypothetical protein